MEKGGSSMTKDAEDDYTSLSEAEITGKNDDVVNGLVEESLFGNDLGQHLLRLAKTAFAAGRKDAVILLEQWALRPATSEPLYQAWAVYYLLATGFWTTTERVLHELLGTPAGRDVILQLVAGTSLAPGGACFMSLAMPEADLQECRAVLAGQRPWADPVQKLQPLLLEFVRGLRAKGQGGWD
jgi:hypothetical protein